jgi:hypothetical protein
LPPEKVGGGREALCMLVRLTGGGIVVVVETTGVTLIEAVPHSAPA